MIDFSTILLDADNEPILDAPSAPLGANGLPDISQAPILTLGRASAGALFTNFPDERDLPADEKCARAALALRVRQAKEIELSPEEASAIKRLLGKAFGGIVLLRAFPLLDPTYTPPRVT